MSVINLDTRYGAIRIDGQNISTICHWYDCGPLFDDIVKTVAANVPNSPSIPDYSAAVADELIKRFGGQITSEMPTGMPLVKDRIY
jgi:hypothetical protein